MEKNNIGICIGLYSRFGDSPDSHESHKGRTCSGNGTLSLCRHINCFTVGRLPDTNVRKSLVDTFALADKFTGSLPV